MSRDHYFGVKELATSDEYGAMFPESFTRRLIFERRIPFRKVGRRVFIAESDIEHFLNSHLVGAGGSR